MGLKGETESSIQDSELNSGPWQKEGLWPLPWAAERSCHLALASSASGWAGQGCFAAEWELRVGTHVPLKRAGLGGCGEPHRCGRGRRQASRKSGGGCAGPPISNREGGGGWCWQSARPVQGAALTPSVLQPALSTPVPRGRWIVVAPFHRRGGTVRCRGGSPARLARWEWSSVSPLQAGDWRRAAWPTWAPRPTTLWVLLHPQAFTPVPSGAQPWVNICLLAGRSGATSISEPGGGGQVYAAGLQAEPRSLRAAPILCLPRAPLALQVSAQGLADGRPAGRPAPASRQMCPPSDLSYCC